jgi:hypothetical protein
MCASSQKSFDLMNQALLHRIAAPLWRRRPNLIHSSFFSLKNNCYKFSFEPFKTINSFGAREYLLLERDHRFGVTTLCVQKLLCRRSRYLAS